MESPALIRRLDPELDAELVVELIHDVFPYTTTPHNGRNSEHNPRQAASPLLNVSARGVAGTGATA